MDDEALIKAIKEDRAQRAKEHAELLAALRNSAGETTITPASPRARLRRAHEQGERRAAEARERGASFMDANRARNGGDDGA